MSREKGIWLSLKWYSRNDLLKKSSSDMASNLQTNHWSSTCILFPRSPGYKPRENSRVTYSDGQFHLQLEKSSILAIILTCLPTSENCVFVSFYFVFFLWLPSSEGIELFCLKNSRSSNIGSRLLLSALEVICRTMGAYHWVSRNHYLSKDVFHIDSSATINLDGAYARIGIRTVLLLDDAE